MHRLYDTLLAHHLQSLRQMAFLTGPRQVGKTTTALNVKTHMPNFHYLNWDNQDHQIFILKGPKAIWEALNLERLSEQVPLIVLDEIHKYRKWKIFLKGFFDTYGKRIKIIVTGSAKLDFFRSSGESLMGRYFPYRIHPLSVGELLHAQSIRKSEVIAPQKIDDTLFQKLYQFGGFPEPFLKNDMHFSNTWHNLRLEQLFKDDLRDLTRIHEIKQMQILATLLQAQVGQLINYTHLAKSIRISVDTVRRWCQTLNALYYCYFLEPWHKNVRRSLLKEPKVFLWDWSVLEDPGARNENFIASHLLKAIHYWNDTGFGKFGLYFVRDKEKREVDFLITKNQKPWILVEGKTGTNHSLSSHLHYFQDQLRAPHAFQLAFNLDFTDRDCFQERGPIWVPAKTFLSQLI